MADSVRSLHVDVVNEVPLGVREGEERLVSEDAGVADDDLRSASESARDRKRQREDARLTVKGPKGINGGLDELLAFLRRANDCDGLASRCEPLGSESSLDAQRGENWNEPLMISATTPSAFSLFMSLMTTLAPSLAYMSAYDRPRPAPAPVIRATLPSKRTGSGCGLEEIFFAFSRYSWNEEKGSGE